MTTIFTDNVVQSGGTAQFLNTQIDGTLFSSGNSTIGTSPIATANSFGTGGNFAAVNNTIGSSSPGSLTDFNGAVAMNGMNQNTDELKISNVTGGYWGERITSAPSTGGAYGIISTSSAPAGNNATSGRFVATSGENLVGVQSNVSGGTATNIGEDITATGAGSVGVNVHSGAITGIAVDASNAATINGLYVTGVRNTGINVNFASGVAGGPRGMNVDMANANGAYNGIQISNLSNNAANGININNMTGGTGIGIAMASTGTGISLIGMGTSAGIHVGAPTTGQGLDMTGPSALGGNAIRISSGTGTAIQVGGPNTGSAAAINVTAGQIRDSVAVQTNPGTASGQFAGRVAYSGTSPIIIKNSLAIADSAAGKGDGSTIVCTFDSNNARGTIVYAVSIVEVSNGSFEVACTSPSAGYINYIIFNH